MRNPEPFVYFADLADSSLNLRLRVFIRDANYSPLVRNDLRFKVFSALKRAGIDGRFRVRFAAIPRYLDVEFFGERCSLLVRQPFVSGSKRYFPLILADFVSNIEGNRTSKTVDIIISPESVSRCGFSSYALVPKNCTRVQNFITKNQNII